MAGRIACVALVSVALASAAAADVRPDAFAVGVLRRDGVVLPFAVFDGKRWSDPWPRAMQDVTVPVDLRAVPQRWWGVGTILHTWDLLIADRTRAAHVVQPDWVDVHCARYIGLRTDYQPAQPVPPAAAQPYPKDGLAVSPPHEIERIEQISLGDGEIRALLPVVRTAFNDAEREVESRYGHPITRRAREGVVPTLEAVYAFGDGPRFYYVEATRPYRHLGQQVGECAAIGSGTGWFVRDASGVRAVDVAVDLLNCDREAGSYMLPLGVVRAKDHVYWLAQFSGWHHERYVVLDVKKKRVEVVINRWGGAC